MKNKIVLDSSGDTYEFADVDFACAPLKILTDAREFVDDSNLDVAEMVEFLKSYKGKAPTACPGVGEYMDCFGDAENVYVVTITGTLSGSYNSASTAANTYMEENPGRKVHVFDSLSTGPEMILISYKLREYIKEGLSFEEIVEKVEAYKKTTHLVFALESLHNLVNNGRVSAAAAMVAGVLGIRMVGKASEEGTLEPLAKVKGAKKVVPELYKQMEILGYKGGKVVVCQCENPEAAEKVRATVQEKYPQAYVEIRETGGLCSFYAERGGMLVGFECE